MAGNKTNAYSGTTYEEQLIRAAKRALSSAFGPAWKNLDRDEKDNLAGAVYGFWSQPGGVGVNLGRVEYYDRPATRAEKQRGAAKGQSIKTVEAPLIVMLPEEAALIEELRPIARRVAKEATEARNQEYADADLASDSKGAGAALRTEADVLVRPDQASADTRSLDYFLRQVAALKAGDAAAQTRAALIEIHLGRPMLPGVPSYFTEPDHGELRKLGLARSYAHDPRLSLAFRDMRTYHAVAEAKSSAEELSSPSSSSSSASTTCPSCRRLAKFLRVPGLGPGEVAFIMNDFMLQVRLSAGI